MATKHKNLLAVSACIMLAGCAALVGLLAQTSLAVVFFAVCGPVAILCGMIAAYWQGENMPHLEAAYSGVTSLAIACMVGAGLSFLMVQADIGIRILGLFGLGNLFAICLIATVGYMVEAIETHAETSANPRYQTT